MPDRGFEILLEDDAVLARRQAVGHRHASAAGHRQPRSRASRRTWPATATPAEVYLGIPHRLDRPVSGAIVFAKTRRAARQLCQAVRTPTRPKALLGLRRADRRAARRAPGPTTCARSTASREHDGRRQLASRRQEAILHYRTVGCHRPARGWRSSSRPAARTRFACRPRRAGFRCWATCTTGRRFPSDRSTKTSGCGRSRCTLA